ncbi:uncharacterized protein EDB93DRAFT_1054106, partial [Suillus bovinus]|uniref:uncharacterized protein n=1 Tax=Suillus bovinus TaxID=48563 RepID=UPI001B85F148
DHINQEIWSGDIILGQCDLSLAWREGCKASLLVLTMSELNLVHYSFTELFKDPAINVLCPFEQNKYLRITSEKRLEDVSRIPKLSPLIPPTSALQHLETVLSADEDHELMLTFQEALIDEFIVDCPPTPSSSQLLPTNPLVLVLPQGPGIHPEDYLLYSGHWIHKQTIFRLVINKDFISKSLNRLECVRAGYTKVNKC